MAMTVDELRQQLAMNTYTPKTDDQMRTEAQNKYTSAYNQKKLAAQQQYDTTDLALSNQLASLGQSYDKLREQTEKSVRSSVSNLDRYSLQRGMQRSSYNAASIANIYAEGNKSIADIGMQEANARNDLEGQRAQLAGQLADKLAQYDIDYASDVDAYFNELQDQNLQRSQAADQYQNQLLMALYEYGRQKEADDYNRQFEENKYNTNLQLQLDQFAEQKRQAAAAEQLNRDKLALDQAQFDFQKQQYADKMAGASSGGGGSRGGSSGGSGGGGLDASGSVLGGTPGNTPSAYDALMEQLSGPLGTDLKIKGKVGSVANANGIVSKVARFANTTSGTSKPKTQNWFGKFATTIKK